MGYVWLLPGCGIEAVNRKVKRALADYSVIVGMREANGKRVEDRQNTRAPFSLHIMRIP